MYLRQLTRHKDVRQNENGGENSTSNTTEVTAYLYLEMKLSS